MIFHIDVFINNKARSEVVYMTAITQSDKGLSETLLGLVDAVLGEFRKENLYHQYTSIISRTKNGALRNLSINCIFL